VALAKLCDLSHNNWCLATWLARRRASPAGSRTPGTAAGFPGCWLKPPQLRRGLRDASAKAPRRGRTGGSSRCAIRQLFDRATALCQQAQAAAVRPVHLLWAFVNWPMRVWRVIPAQAASGEIAGVGRTGWPRVDPRSPKPRRRWKTAKTSSPLPAHALLDQFGRDLTALAKQGACASHRRREEIRRLARCCCNTVGTMPSWSANQASGRRVWWRAGATDAKRRRASAFRAMRIVNCP